MSVGEKKLAVPGALRVAILSSDPILESRLAEFVARGGHVRIADAAAADVVMIFDADTPPPRGVPAVLFGEAPDADRAGLLPRDATAEQVDAALRAVAAGLVVRMPAAMTGGFAVMDDGETGLLTPREIEVLSAISDGLGNKAIARRLDISLHTVKFHIESIFRKLEVRSRAEAVARGLRYLDL